jgi:hypothetical protein
MAGAPVPVPVSPGGAPVRTDLASQLQQLKALHDQGVLTDDEFQKAKQKLLNQP